MKLFCIAAVAVFAGAVFGDDVTLEFNESATMTFEMAIKQTRLGLPGPLNVAGSLKVTTTVDDAIPFSQCEIKSEGKHLASVSGIDARMIRSQLNKKFGKLLVPFERVNPSEMVLDFKYVGAPTAAVSGRSFVSLKPERNVHFSCRTLDDGANNWAVDFALDEDLKGVLAASFQKQGAPPAVPGEFAGKGTATISDDGGGKDKLLTVELVWPGVSLKLVQSRRSGFDLFVGDLKLGGDVKELNCDLKRNY